jgi:hypothetical protein
MSKLTQSQEQLVDGWIQELANAGLSPDEMINVFKTAGQKYKLLKEKEALDGKIKTVEQAFEYLGLDITKMPDVSSLPKEIQDYIISHYKLTVVVKAINKQSNAGIEWQPDWNDEDQYKYYPYFEVDADDNNRAGVGFSYSLFGFSDTYARVGSRLLFRTSEDAMHAAKFFEDLYKSNHLIK